MSWVGVAQNRNIKLWRPAVNANKLGEPWCAMVKYIVCIHYIFYKKKKGSKKKNNKETMHAALVHTVPL